MLTRVLYLCLSLGLLAPASHAQVRASLVSSVAMARPGEPFTVALRLDHQPHWHTYWLNAGTGYPTSITWDLPAGWTAGEIQWPVPILIKDGEGKVTGHGYDGDLYLPVTITPPADTQPGQNVTLKAKAEWLMCEDSCIPGYADLQLMLPVAAGTSTPDLKGVDKIAGAAAPQPVDLPSGWTARAVRRAKTVMLTVQTTDELKAPHFFSADGLIAYDQPQEVEAWGRVLTLALPLAEDADPAATHLTGVLAYTIHQGGYGGVRIMVPFGSEILPSHAPVNSPSNPSAANGTGFLATLGLAFFGGLILNLMPCVFPVLGIKILGFVKQSGNDRRLITLHGLVFSAGVVASFWALAGVLAALRASGSQLGWGFQLQSPGFVFALAAVMLVFALSLSGVFDFGLRATGVGASLQMKEGYAGSFFTGVLATVVATPCSAPFLAPALGAALALPTGQAFAVFTTIATGLALPYLLLSIFPSAVKVLPRPGTWMETFKQFMAFPLYATVGYLLWVLAGQTGESGLLMAFFGLTLIAMAAWAYGRLASPGAGWAQARRGAFAGLVLLLAGGWTGWPHPVTASDITWTPWSPEAVEEAMAQGKMVYVDFTARWCATCQTNKKIVFTNDEVKARFREQGIVTLKADWTNRDPRITAELAKWNRSAVPFNLIIKPGKPPAPLPELLTPGIVLGALQAP